MTARRGKILLLLALIVAILAIALAAREYHKTHLPEPERCALCGREYVCHAPALLNLATGEIASLEIYAFDPFLPDEIDKSRTGFMCLSRAAGVQVCMEAGYSTSVILPDKVEPMDCSLYCRGCRALLSEAGATKPRRKARSTERASGRSGVWGLPQRAFREQKKDIPKHCSRILHTQIMQAFPKTAS